MPSRSSKGGKRPGGSKLSAKRGSGRRNSPGPADSRPAGTGNRAGAGTTDGRHFVTTRVEVEGREEIKLVERPAFEPEPWDDGARLSAVGARLPRVDAVEKVTGSARYTADVRRPGMLYAAILRAPIARGRVTHLDLAPALRLAGVRDAIARPDVPAIRVGGVELFDPLIRYVGQPVAAVCAESEELAGRALWAIAVRYESEPHAVTVEQALAPDAPHVRGTGNLADESPRVSERGDVARGLERADVVIEREYRVPVALHTALEPHGAVAEWTGEQLTLWESTQGVFGVRDDIASAFALRHSHVRVIKQYMGGGFGAKNGAGAQSYVAVALALRVGRPVRCVLDREAEQTDSGNRPASIQRVTLAATREGALTAMILDADIPLGIGGWQGGPGKIYHQMYSCPNVRTLERFVYINASAMSSFRAPGHVEGAFGLERAMDVLAMHLEMDPLELRLANYATGDEENDRPYTAKRLDECYRMGAERFDWSARRRTDGRGAEGVTARARKGAIFPAGGAPHPPLPVAATLRRGIGLASQVWGGGGGPPAYATVRINPDGSIDVLTGSQDLGTGTRTALAQIAADALGARLEDVRVVLGDTERTPYTGNSWGSMTTASVGPAVRLAAEQAREQLLEAAAQMMETSPERLELVEGEIRVLRGRKRKHIADVTRELGDVMIIGHGNRGPNPDHATIATFGAQFAEVEVDMETGIVRVLRIVAAHDSGRIINPTLAESQLEGGIVQGLGYALFEERILDARIGAPLNPTMHDYKIPTIADIPTIDAFFVGGVDVEANHTGAKGLGEPPIIPTAPAIANAVADAIGAEIDELPMTPWRVLDAIRRG